MENTKFPIVIKKRNGGMLIAAIIEIVIAIIFGIAGGIKSAPLWIFLFTGVITALSVLVEYNQDIMLKENKVEFYKNNDLIKEIKYSSINSIYIKIGDGDKNKKKEFIAFDFKRSSKSHDPKSDIYLMNPSSYAIGDLVTLKNTILMKNSLVKVEKEVEKFIK